MLTKRAATCFVVSMVLLRAGFATPADQEELRGVVIEEITEDSGLGKAGLQVGDVITAWKRLPNPPANPETAEGPMDSYFDWQALEVEQVPRGTVVLLGHRDGEPLELSITSAIWEAKVRPALSPAHEAIYAQGTAQLAAGDLEAATRTWRVWEEHGGDLDSRELRAWSVLRLGVAWGEKGDWAKAVERFRKALDYARSIPAKLTAWGYIGMAELRRNGFQAAEEAIGSSLKMCQNKSTPSLCAAFNLNRLGQIAWAKGELESAHSYLLQSLEIRELLAPRSLDLASVLSNLGAVTWAMGDLESAGKYLNSARQIEEGPAPQSLALSTTLNNLGTVEQARGQLNSAYSYYSQALYIEQRLAPQSREMATTLSNLGSLTWTRGELNRAHDYFVRALRIEEQLAPESLDLAVSLNNQGNVALARGDLDGAHQYHLRALRIAQAVAPESLEEATSLSSLGAWAWKHGDLNRAREYHLQALSIQQKRAPQSLDVAKTMNYLGNLSLVNGELEGARAQYLQALQIEQQLAPGSYELANSLMGLGKVARSLQDRDLAQSYYTQALAALERQISGFGAAYSVQAGFRFRHRDYYLDLLDLLLTQNQIPEAFQLLERFRGQTFLTMLAERDTAFVTDIPSELDLERRRLSVLYDRTLKELAGLNPRDNASEIEAARKELQRLDDEAGDIEARIRSASPKLAALRYPQPLGATATQRMIDPGTLLLSFSVGKDKTSMFALSHTGNLETKILPLGEETLRSRTKQLLTLIPEAKGGSSLSEQRRTQLQAISRELYTELLAPVADRIAASERLLILPDGPLHALPFGALVHDTEDGPQYLGAWKPLHVALSATVFAELRQGRRPAGDQDTVPAPLQLAAFGDPVYPQRLRTMKISAAALPADGDVVRGDPTVRGAAERGLFDFQPLPYSRREVQGIAGLFPQGSARTFLGAEALEERIKSLDPNTRILHLSAHGSIDEHLPSGSFIALTIPEEAASEETGPQRDNGLLQVWEIFERVRLNADLVVLSACDTGLGEELGGEGLIGLTRAFQYAGARTVMASLWSVQDQATAELMIRFYKHLRAGLTKDRALQAAQQELLRGPIEVTNDKGERVLKDFSAPYYWAGFQLYGDWQ